MKSILPLLAVAALLAGCSSKTDYVPDTAPKAVVASDKIAAGEAWVARQAALEAGAAVIAENDTSLLLDHSGARIRVTLTPEKTYAVTQESGASDDARWIAKYSDILRRNVSRLESPALAFDLDPELARKKIRAALVIAAKDTGWAVEGVSADRVSVSLTPSGTLSRLYKSKIAAELRIGAGNRVTAVQTYGDSDAAPRLLQIKDDTYTALHGGFLLGSDDMDNAGEKRLQSLQRAAETLQGAAVRD